MLSTDFIYRPNCLTLSQLELLDPDVTALCESNPELRKLTFREFNKVRKYFPAVDLLELRVRTYGECCFICGSDFPDERKLCPKCTKQNIEQKASL